MTGGWATIKPAPERFARVGLSARVVDAAQLTRTVGFDANVDDPNTSFPAEYSLTRALLVNNPTALLTGEDWQDVQTDADIYAKSFFKHFDGTPVADTRQAVVGSDPMFGTVVKCYQTDRNTLLPGATELAKATVQSSRTFSGRSRAWFRYTMRFQSGFTTEGPGGGAAAWKWAFGGYNRHIAVTNTTAFQWNAWQGGGTEQLLPQSDGWTFQVTPYWTNSEWLEVIAFEERIDATTYRLRYWFREMSTGLVWDGPPSSATWDKRQGWIWTGTTVEVDGSDKIELGVNRNKDMHPGQQQWWYWGPWEVIDADVILDPYGIEDQNK